MDDLRTTRAVTEEEVRHAVEFYHTPSTAQSPFVDHAPVAQDCPPIFRPIRRPTTPILIVCDDGLDEGETIRIRKDRFVIGRTEGDLTIPNDAMISTRHAELRHSLVGDKHRWSLLDLQSTNGTYVRVDNAVLKHHQEFLIGSTRFRFENRSTDPFAASPQNYLPQQGASLRQNPGSEQSGAAVVQVTGVDKECRFPLAGPETWLGKDASNCRVAVPADRHANARHARIRRQPDGRWILENNKSVNGVWLRLEQMDFTGVCRFMLGEQRFIIRTPH